METRTGERGARWVRAVRTCIAIVAGIAAVTAASCSGIATTGKPAEMSTADLVARGRQISYSSGCNDCHTPGGLYGAPDTTRMLSGSELGWEGPWGVSFPRNLTPDMDTGIGRWTEEQIVTAFRAGHRPDGSPLLPPMAWAAYAHMSDADAHALATFLKSLPAVRHKVPDVIKPGTRTDVARLVFPPPPAWDAQNLSPPPSTEAPAETSATGK